MIQKLILLGMYFDAVVVSVTSQTLLFRLALVMLWVERLVALADCRTKEEVLSLRELMAKGGKSKTNPST